MIEGSYLEPFPYVSDEARGGLEMSFASLHRPLETYTEALTEPGLAIERLREIAFPEHAFTDAESARWTRIPLFLQLRGVKLAG